MRIANKNSLNLTRKSGTKSPNLKIFIIPEGDVTEIIYFDGIDKNREYLKIKPLIELIVLENEDKEKGESHPLKKLKNFKDDLNEGKHVYYPEIDKVAFVVDRDKQNFKENQYDEFIKKCKKEQYNVYVSNPTFEFFLLLHSDEVFNIDKKEMLENRRSENKKNGKRFLELELSKIFGCNKKNLNFNKFKDNIERAIENEKQFCEDLYRLKNELGSNVGVLLTNLINKDS